MYVCYKLAQVARVMASLVHPAYGGSIHVYIQPPPLLLSARTFNNIGGISVQGARRVLPPLLLSHVKQCTLYSRVNHCRERIFKRGFYVCVVICVQCGLLPKKVYLFYTFDII